MLSTGYYHAKIVWVVDNREKMILNAIIYEHIRIVSCATSFVLNMRLIR